MNKSKALVSWPSDVANPLAEDGIKLGGLLLVNPVGGFEGLETPTN